MPAVEWGAPKTPGRLPECEPADWGVQALHKHQRSSELRGSARRTDSITQLFLPAEWERTQRSCRILAGE